MQAYTTRDHARVIRVHDRLWRIPGDTGYALQSRKSRPGAIRLARQMYPGKPVHVFTQGPFLHRQASLTLLEIVE